MKEKNLRPTYVFDPVMAAEAEAELRRLATHPPKGGESDDLDELPELPTEEEEVVAELRKR